MNKFLTLVATTALTFGTTNAMAQDDDWQVNEIAYQQEQDAPPFNIKRIIRNKTFLRSLNKQHAYFEGSQIVRRFFLCIPEASNFKEDYVRVDEVKTCFNDIVSPAIELDLNGSLSTGIDSTIQIATEGLAQLRQNASFSPTSFYISHYEEGNRPGTGRMELNFNVLVHQEIIQSTDVELPFEPLLGPQLFVSNNTLGVIATKPGEWKIDLLKVRSIFTEQRPDISYQNPFPNYPIN